LALAALALSLFLPFYKLSVGGVNVSLVDSVGVSAVLPALLLVAAAAGIVYSATAAKSEVWPLVAVAAVGILLVGISGSAVTLLLAVKHVVLGPALEITDEELGVGEDAIAVGYGAYLFLTASAALAVTSLMAAVSRGGSK
jgi:hypothetical protein